MKMGLLFCLGALSLMAVACRQQPNESVASAAEPKTNLRAFTARGIVRELKRDSRTVVIAHEAISNYMGAMTMPFKVKQVTELAGLWLGDEISFRLLVSESESWIDRIVRTGRASLAETKPGTQPASETPTTKSRHPLMDYKFTNELRQAVSLSQFDGQALGITFLFTRCPIPDYCPRLSKNFAEASRKLSAMPDAPTNWHFLSVTFDPEFDTPAVLKSYAERYHYDPTHWSFLTGPADKIAELARLSDVTFEREGSLFNHNFRTLIINAAGQLQMSYPIGGDLSDSIAGEMLKATAVTNLARFAE